MKQHQQEGVTLIELMIVVAIIAILAAFAVPAYFGYIKQAKVAEASVLFAGFKTNLMVSYAMKGTWPTFQELKDKGIVYRGTYVEGTYIDVPDPQVCFKVIGFDVGKDSIGWKYIPSPSDPTQRVWSCKMPESGCTTINNIYLPSNCL
ncbi:PilE/Pilin [Thioploca ingrica]|uniref:PilE/Pilin n=1 Tax=Thioploca ingrica TaxID=40754 RepID=A0A090AHJ2_9GAMM|nr:PilE/Pilin [Thioploca ingrica]